jgi:prepilin-type N-terminal cleavage/methylation domain-containing protein
VSRRSARGLTLLEVLVASALLGVFFVAVFSIVFGAMRTRQQIEDKALPFSIGPVVMQRIEDDLRCAAWEAVADDKDAFKAEAPRDDEVRIDFVSAVPSRERIELKDELVRAYVNEVGYRLRRSEVESDLFALYRREDFGVDSDPTEGGRYHKLCDRVRRFAIDFYGEDPGDPGGDDAKGVTDWDARKEKKLPWGCRVTLVLAGTAQTDDEGALVAQARDVVFETYVPFRNRYDKADSAPRTPGSQNPGSGNR